MSSHGWYMCTHGHPHVSSHGPLKTSSHPAVRIHVSPILTCRFVENPREWCPVFHYPPLVWLVSGMGPQCTHETSRRDLHLYGFCHVLSLWVIPKNLQLRVLAIALHSAGAFLFIFLCFFFEFFFSCFIFDVFDYFLIYILFSFHVSCS